MTPALRPPLLFVTPAYGRSAVGGLGASAERIVHHLAAEYSVQVITPADDLPPCTWAAAEIAGIARCRVGRSADAALFLQCLADLLDELSRGPARPLFLGFYCSDLAYAATLSAARRGTTPILFARGNDIDLDLLGEGAFRIHYALGRARRVFCVSREIAAKIRAFRPEAKVRYLPNGVDEKAFRFHQRYAPNPRPVVGLFGDVKHKKGLELLLGALDFDRFDLCVIGRLREESRKLLHGFLSLYPQHQPRIKALPYTEDAETLREHYRNVDIVCVPSVHEGMSNVMLEAMAMGRVCVCSAVGGAPDVIRDGENGFLCEPRSVESLAAALFRARDCLRGEHEAVRRAARDTIVEGYTAHREGKRYLRALRAICS